MEIEVESTLKITKRAWLICEGACSKHALTPTRHFFFGDKLERPEDGSLNRIFFYGCEECDAVRIWGNECLIQPKRKDS